MALKLNRYAGIRKYRIREPVAEELILSLDYDEPGSGYLSMFLRFPPSNTMTIDWGDGKTTSWTGSEDPDRTQFTSSYDSPGLYSVTMSGDVLNLNYIELYGGHDIYTDITPWSEYVNLSHIYYQFPKN